MALQLLNSKFRRILTKESDKWNPNGPWRLPSFAYTSEHKLAFLEREHYLLGSYSFGGMIHDVDKLFMYLNPFLKEEEIQQIHRNSQPHHINEMQKKVKHLMEMYIDWDCAAITKPDKPLDAYATLLHFYQEQIMLMFPICLAISPDRVSPFVMDLDKKRKNGYSAYLFQSEEYNRQWYQKARFCMATIALSKEMNIANIVNGNIHEMEPRELFYFCLAIMAQRRKQKINQENVQKVLQEKYELFKGYQSFKCAKDIEPIKHDYKALSPNPFFI